MYGTWILIRMHIDLGSVNMSPIFSPHFQSPNGDRVPIVPRLILWSIGNRTALRSRAPHVDTLPWPRCAHGPEETSVPVSLAVIAVLYPAIPDPTSPTLFRHPNGVCPEILRLRAYFANCRYLRDQIRQG